MSILHIKTPNGVEEEINLSSLATIDTPTTFQNGIYITDPLEFKQKFSEDAVDDEAKGVIYINQAIDDGDIVGHEIYLGTTNRSCIDEYGRYTIGWSGIDESEGVCVGNNGTRIALRPYIQDSSFCTGEWNMISTNGVDTYNKLYGRPTGRLNNEYRCIVNGAVKSFNRIISGMRGSGYIIYDSGFMVQWGNVQTTSQAPYELTFPLSFTTTPTVQGCISNLSTTNMLIVKTDSVTKDGCALVPVRVNNTYCLSGTRVYWMAIGW